MTPNLNSLSLSQAHDLDCSMRWSLGRKYTPLLPPTPVKLGTVIHAALSCYYTHGDLGLVSELIDGIYATEIRPYLNLVDDASKYKEIPDQAKAIMERYFDACDDDLNTVLGTEIDRTVSIAGYPFRRILDLVLDYGDYVLVLDHKTTSRAGDYLDEISELNPEAIASVMVAEALYGKPASFAYNILVTNPKAKRSFYRQPVYTGKMIQLDFLAWIDERMRRREQLLRGVEPVTMNLGSHCRFCPFHAVCMARISPDGDVQWVLDNQFREREREQQGEEVENGSDDD